MHREPIWERKPRFGAKTFIEFEMKYAGTCKVHGLIAHEATQAQMDIKGGPYCPYCGMTVTVIASDKEKRSLRRKQK